jgi:hypothetical protein
MSVETSVTASLPRQPPDAKVMSWLAWVLGHLCRSDILLQ